MIWKTKSEDYTLSTLSHFSLDSVYLNIVEGSWMNICRMFIYVLLSNLVFQIILYSTKIMTTFNII